MSYCCEDLKKAYKEHFVDIMENNNFAIHNYIDRWDGSYWDIKFCPFCGIKIKR